MSSDERFETLRKNAEEQARTLAEAGAEAALAAAMAAAANVLANAEAKAKALTTAYDGRMQELARRNGLDLSALERSDTHNLPQEQACEPQSGMTDTRTFHDVVAERAYYKAEQRGFGPGQDTQDWLEAERELLPVASSRNLDSTV